ncbi:MAG: tetratricopeptide repeat protein [Proteobacteria bacterium]|nr:tetratricopeptide repeat protein [Pseudomonadota bacterium]
MMRSLVIVIIVFGSLIFAVDEAPCDARSNEAKKQLEIGQKYFSSGQLRQAADAFRRSYQLDGNYETLYDLAHVETGLNNYQQALTFFTRYLQEGGDRVPVGLRKIAQTEIKRLRFIVAQTYPSPTRQVVPQAPVRQMAPQAPTRQAMTTQNAAVHIQKGRAYQQQGQLEWARAEFEEAYSISPHYDTLYLLGRVESRLNQHQKAIATFGRYLAEGGAAVPPHRRVEVEREINRMNALLSQSTNQGEAARLLAEGRNLYSKRKYKKAWVTFDKAYKLYPNFELYYFIGKTAARLGQSEKAVGMFNRYLKEGGSKVSTSQRDDVNKELSLIQESDKKEESNRYFKEGLEWYRSGEFDRAVSLYEQAHQVYPNYEILYNLGQAEHKAKHYTNAREVYERYLKEGGRNVSRKRQIKVQKQLNRLIDLEVKATDKKKAAAHYKDGVKLNKEKRYQEALVEFEDAYRLYQDYRFLRGIGKSAVGLKRYDLAISAYTRYLDNGGSKVTPGLRSKVEREVEWLSAAKEGHDLFSNDDYDGALEAYDKAYALHPHYEFLYYIGKSAAKLEQNEKALDSYNRYLKDGSDKALRNRLGEAKNEIERIGVLVDEDKRKEESRHKLDEGVGYYENGDFKRASDLFKEAYKLDPNYEILYNLGRAEFKVKNYTNARVAYENYLEKGKNNIPKKQRVKVKNQIDKFVALEAKKADKKKSVAHYKNGLKLYKKNSYEEALVELEKAYKLHQNYKILRGIGKAAGALKRYRPAIKAYERYLNNGGSKISSEKRDSVNQEIERLRADEETARKKKQSLEYYKAGRTLSKEGSCKEAIAEFEKAHKLHANYKILYNIAKNEALLENHRKAIDTYNRYLVEGGGKISHKQRAKLNKELPRLRAAADIVEKKERSKQYYETGLSRKDQKKYEEAIYAFEEAYKLDSNYEILLPMAQCNAKLKNNKKALEIYNRYLNDGSDRISKKQRVNAKKETDRLNSLVNKK